MRLTEYETGMVRSQIRRIHQHSTLVETVASGRHADKEQHAVIRAARRYENQTEAHTEHRKYLQTTHARYYRLDERGND